MAFFLKFPFHITPINKPAIDIDKESKAIHCAGSSDIITLTIVGFEYVIRRPDIKRLINKYFWFLSGWILIKDNIFLNIKFAYKKLVYHIRYNQGIRNYSTFYQLFHPIFHCLFFSCILLLTVLQRRYRLFWDFRIF